MKLPPWRIAEIAAGTGEFAQELAALGYSTDARALNPGNLFIILAGDGFDCPDDIEAALRRGGCGRAGRGGAKNPSRSGSCAFRGRYVADA